MAVGRLARPRFSALVGAGLLGNALSGRVPSALAEDPCIALNGNPIQGGVLWGVAEPLREDLVRRAYPCP